MKPVLGTCLVEATFLGQWNWFLLVCWWTVVAEWWLFAVLVLKSVGDEPTWKAESGVGSQDRNVMDKGLPYNQNGLPPMINAMLIVWAKSGGARRGSHQPGFMGSCLAISHSCLLCLTSGTTLLFWNNLFVVWRVVSWEGGRCGRVMSCKGWKGGKVVSWKGGRMVSWLVR